MHRGPERAGCECGRPSRGRRVERTASRPRTGSGLKEDLHRGSGDRRSRCEQTVTSGDTLGLCSRPIWGAALRDTRLGAEAICAVGSRMVSGTRAEPASRRRASETANANRRAPSDLGLEAGGFREHSECTYRVCTLDHEPDPIRVGSTQTKANELKHGVSFEEAVGPPRRAGTIRSR